MHMYNLNADGKFFLFSHNNHTPSHGAASFNNGTVSDDYGLPCHNYVAACHNQALSHNCGEANNYTDNCKMNS